MARNNSIVRRAGTRHGPPSCPICWGRECCGGGNKQCVQRDPKPSHIAGILDSFGGVRVVVAHKQTFKHHLGRGEFLCVVPDKLVHEPIASGDIPFVVRLGEIAVETFVARNAQTNDADKQEAVRAYRSRQSWHQQHSLHWPSLVLA